METRAKSYRKVNGQIQASLTYFLVEHHFQQFLVRSQQCLVVTGSSMLTAASLKYHATDTNLTWCHTSHNPDAGSTSPSEEQQLSTIFKDFSMLRPRIEPMTSHSLKRTLYRLSYHWLVFVVIYSGKLTGTGQTKKIIVTFSSTPIPSKYELPHHKTTKWHVRPAKTQISLGICPVWSE